LKNAVALSFALLLVVAGVANSATTTVSYQVAEPLDDGHATSTTIQSTTYSALLYIGDNNRYLLPFMRSAMRFTNIQVPRHARINSAHLKIHTYQYGSEQEYFKGAVRGIIQAEAAGNPPNFSSSNRSIGTIVPTNTGANWDHKFAWEPAIWYTSPDISVVLQEVVDRPDFGLGNAVVIIYSTREITHKYRAFYSADNPHTYAPKLEITYEYYTISGYVTTATATPIEGTFIHAGAAIEGDVTDASGYYELKVPPGWSGTVTPSKADWGFSPASQTYNNVTSDQINQDYTAFQPKISGYARDSEGAGVEAVSISADNGGGSDTTDITGFYEIIVPYNWSGSVTASKSWWGFNPPSISYSNLTENQPNQDFTAFAPPVISGYIKDGSGTGVEGVLVPGDNGGVSDYTDANGFYKVVVPYNWSGKIMPAKSGLAFNPIFLNYNNVIEDFENQDFIAYPHIYGGGSGTQEDPYLIVSSSQFYRLKNRPEDWDKHFKLLTDVTVSSGFIIAPDEDTGLGDYQGDGFNGVLDGDGHAINGVYFYFTDTWKYYYGLFGCIGEQGVVKNLYIEDATLISYLDYTGVFAPLAAVNYGTIDNCHTTGTVKASGACAGLVARNYGFITNSSADGSTQGLGPHSGSLGGLVAQNYYGIISDCFSNVLVSEGRYHLGGLVGINLHGLIERSGATGSVSAVGEGYFDRPKWIGGLVGFNYEGRIERSYADVSLSAEDSSESIGGLVGANTRAEIFSCYSTGSVSVGNGSKKIGGLVGYCLTSGLTNCYSASLVSAPNAIDDVGGLVGVCSNSRSMIYLSYWDTGTSGIDYSDGGIGLTTAQMQDINSYFGWGDNTWTIDNGNDYPKLAFQNLPGIQIIDPPRTYAGGSGTEHSPYLIQNTQQLNTISLYPGDWQKHFELIDDINLAETSNDFFPLGYGSGFTGVFDGNGHTIRNLTIDVNQDSHSGLFALISYDGVVKNLNLDNFYIDIGLPEYGGIAGTLAATNKGTVENCHSNGLVKAVYYIGGLTGVNWGDISESTFTGNVICRSLGGGLVGSSITGTILDSSSFADIQNSNDAFCVGGLVGVNGGSSILNCLSTGSVNVGEGSTWIGGLVGLNNDSLVSHCYSIGSVTAGPNSVNIGGFAGENSFETIINSWSSGSVSAGDNSVYVGGLVGYNYAKVSNCYSKGNVTGNINVGGLVGYSHGSKYVAGDGLIEYSYCTGLVIGDANVGGLVGVVSDSNVVSSFWDMNSCGIEISAGGVGLSTIQMMHKSTYTDAGWDFIDETVNGTEEIWRLCQDGIDYPKFSWEFSSDGDFMCPDGVTLVDFSILAAAWMSKPNDASWNPVCDISEPNDNTIDESDLKVLVDNWLRGL
jgi:hypothetical protein